MFVRVIVDAPLAQPLEYLLPAGGDPREEATVVGRCCTVPLGRRRVVGVIVETCATPNIATDRVRALDAVLHDVAPLPPLWLELTRFAADYYQHAWGEVAIGALPPQLRVPPGPRFVAALNKLRVRATTATGQASARCELNAEQAAAAQAIAAARHFATFVLFGVTGSGKTEVYLEAIARRLAADPAAQALLLVPEINLTPQLEQRLQARFPGEMLVSLHSALPAGQRTAGWLAAHEGRARIVLGTRLAVFAPLPRLALVVVDEEHDPSFKAGDGVRYSARDLAIKRAQLADVPVVLGSATPALETWFHAAAGKYALLRLRTRPLDAPRPSAASGAPADWPQVSCVDLRQHPPAHGLCAPVAQAVRETLARGEQTLVFINRRGYAPVLACEACGWLSTCPRCATFAAFHKPDRTLRCHHCGWQASLPRACPTCGNQDLAAVGHGTQRVEETLQMLEPAARILRIDRDSTRRKGTAAQAFEAVHAGDVDILVGTQMISKGHDFRRVSLVVVLNADAQLVSHDFRAPERLFSTLVQVAGRAGRSGLASRVLVQTRYPRHPLFAALARYDFEGFATDQLAERRAARLPPFVGQALLTAQARSMDSALSFLAAARALPAADGLRRFDPVPMPLARLAGVHRAQLLAEADTRAELQAGVSRWLHEVRDLASRTRPRPRWQIEVDPAEI
jgi:primosomal protein N' (replication factor Y)